MAESRPSRPAPLVPMAAHGHQIQGHQVVLPPEPEAAEAALAAALATTAPDGRRAALLGCCAAVPAHLDAWARLGQALYAEGDAVLAYACARAGYHRGLDRLRRHGWGGTGQVLWAAPSNRGFLRALHLLMAAAAALGEMDEAERCRAFLLDLDPDDGIGLRSQPPLAAGDRLAAPDLP